MRSVAICLALLCAASTVSAMSVKYTPAALADQIHSLPGLNVQPGFNQFSGYLTVDASSNRSIFYWYVESQKDSVNDPLIWWSNGGPGCSGLLGMLTEHGPFRVAPGGKGLEVFPYAWNNLANVLYVEAPAGVGYSFSDNPADYYTDDAKTAKDNYAAIQAFFVKFPHLLKNDFFISGESYGGHYIPTLAQQIVDHNDNPPSGYAKLNFQGFLLGNPLTDMDENTIWGQAGTLCGHSLASRPTCDAFIQHCVTSRDSQCDGLLSRVADEAGALDLYGLDFPTCPAQRQAETLLRAIYMKKMKSPGFSEHLRQRLLAKQASTYDPCMMSEETIYLNRKDVRAALHASDKNGEWQSCNQDTLHYNMSDLDIHMQPIYKDLISRSKLRMTIFSGDDDAICATTGTQHWIYDLLGVRDSWAPWYYNDKTYGRQIGGYVTKFNGVSLATVHGAGHMVSTYQPEKGFAVLEKYLAGDFN